MDQKAPAPREEVNCPVWIDRRASSPLMSCPAVNPPRTGVKLAIAPNVALPDPFVVRFTPGGDLAMVAKWSGRATVPWACALFGRVDDNAPAIG